MLPVLLFLIIGEHIGAGGWYWFLLVLFGTFQFYKAVFGKEK